MGLDYTPDFSLPRDRRLFSGGPKRILAMDGGGIRGLISLGILSIIEETLAAKSSDPENFRLAHYYDLIAGTSTGSIIAAALAQGWTVAKVRNLYESLGPTLFPPTSTLGILKFRRQASKLQKVLKDQLGDMSLESEKLVTGLLICAKRIDTDSAWILTNCPKAKYWDNDGSWKPNKDYEVAMIVRASAAAPTFFEPVKIDISDGKSGYPKETGLFVDGAISGHNNPAVSAIMTSTLPSYGFGEVDATTNKPSGWSIGDDQLLVTNVGTGWYRERQDPKEFLKKIPAKQAIDSLKGMINDTVRNDLHLLQAISNPTAPWYLNTEVGDLDAEYASKDPMISYQRYDGRLTENVFLKAIDMLGDDRTDRARELAFGRIMKMDNGTDQNIKNAYDFGRWVATPDAEDEAKPPSDRERQGVRFEHFPSGFNGVLDNIEPFNEDTASA